VIPLLLALVATAAPPAPSAEAARAEAQAASDPPDDAALRTFAALAAHPVHCHLDGTDDILLGATDNIDLVALQLGDRFYTPRAMRRLIEVTRATGVLPDVDLIRRKGRGWPVVYAAGFAGEAAAAASLADADARAWALALSAALGLTTDDAAVARVRYPSPPPPDRAKHCRPL
jgi:hypothetical protein